VVARCFDGTTERISADAAGRVFIPFEFRDWSEELGDESGKDRVGHC
jgi:DNA-binding transcriptional regulator/RsmH inhibitor MraZ